MFSITYLSTASTVFDDGDLGTLLMHSRANNRRLDLTGLLLHKDGQFLQVLEGPEDQVAAKYTRISADPRHAEVTILAEESIESRRFPDWTMAYEPITDTLADEIPGYRTLFTPGILPSAASTLPALTQLLTWFQSRPQAAA